MMLKPTLATLLLVFLAAQANAVSLRSVIRECGNDGKKYCPTAGYGQPMQDCLTQNFSKLAPACKGVIAKLNNGEHVTFF
jgi:hypothetical protein